MARDLFEEAGIDPASEGGRDLFAEADALAGDEWWAGDPIADGGAKRQSRKSQATAADYLRAVDSGLAQGISGIAGGIGTFIQDPAANALSGVSGAAAAADRGVTWAINALGGDGTAKTSDAIQENAQTASRFAAESRAAQAADPSNLPARFGLMLQKDSERANREISARDKTTNPELIAQQQNTGQAEGFWDNLAAIKDNPLAFTNTMARSLPDMAAGVGVGSVAHRAGAGLARVGTVGTLSEAGSSAMQSRQGVYQQVNEMPLETLAKSPRYQAVLAQADGNPEQAREILANELADQVPLLAGAGTALGTVLTNKLFGGDATAKTIAGVDKMGAREFGKRVAQDTLEEVVQGLPEDAVQHGAAVQADPSQKYDPAGSAAQNMAAGFAMGAGGHGMGYARENLQRADKAPAPAPNADKGLTADVTYTRPDGSTARSTGTSPPADTVATGNTEAAERALKTPVQLTALDRADTLSAELKALSERQQELDPANGYGPAFDGERQELATKAAELGVEREGITKTWPAAQRGTMSSFTTEAGARLEAQYALMDAADLVTSHDEGLRVNPLFPQEMQPRDRSRQASELQVASIVQKLDPARLGLSADAANGAPIVGADGLVESGNARTIALKRVYQANGQKAQDYKQFLRDNAAQFGLAPESIESMGNPVLVRVRATPVNRAEFARQANASTVQEMGPSEKALADAKRLTTLEGLNPDEQGDFDNSTDFIRQFMATLPVTEQSGMIESDGRLSTAGYRRIQNAVLARAYGDSPSLRRMTESRDNNLLNISKALVRVAPTIAAARERMDAGTLHQADIAPDLLAAVEGLSALKDKGWKVADELGQGDLTGPKYSPESAELLTFLADNARSPRRIAEFFQRYYEALEQAGDPTQPSMFGDEGPAPTRVGLINKAKETTNGNNDQNAQRGVAGEGAQVNEGDGGRPQDAPRDQGRDQGNGPTQADAAGRQPGEPTPAAADEGVDRGTQQVEPTKPEETPEQKPVKAGDTVTWEIKGKTVVGEVVREPGREGAATVRATSAEAGAGAKAGGVFSVQAERLKPLQKVEQKTKEGKALEPVLAENNTPDEKKAPATTTTAPAGQNPKIDTPLQTTTPAFKKWFGDSKVVDAQGAPLVVYHATTADFNIFDRSAESIFSYGNNPDAGGIFFDADPKVVDNYSDPKQTGMRVLPVYLKIEKPAILPANMALDKQAAALKKAEETGHDGAILGGLEYVVFRPEQIKSAIGNSGAFDPGNPDIRFSFAGARAETVERHAMMTAQDRIAAGEDAELVRRETGWHTGADGRWRFEIADNEARLLLSAKQTAEAVDFLGRVTVGDVLDHPKLFAAYPALAQIPVEMKDGKGASLAIASINGVDQGKTILMGRGIAQDNFLSVLLHELQHGIQHIEGFAVGGSLSGAAEYQQQANGELLGLLEESPVLEKAYTAWAKIQADIEAGRDFDAVQAEAAETALEAIQKGRRAIDLHSTLEGLADPVSAPSVMRDRYRRLAGEVEARNTQARQNMGAAERATTPPSKTADVQASDVIVVVNGKEMAKAPAPANALVQAATERAANQSGMPVDELQALADRIADKNPRMPKVNVLADPSKAPKALRDYIIEQGAENDVDGAMHEGELYLFASGLTDALRAEHVLLEHEAAHFGLRAILGDSLTQAMNLIYANNGAVRKAATEMKRYGKLSNAAAVEEVLVDIPSAQLAKLQGWRKFTALARDWLAAHGFSGMATKLSTWLDGTLTDQQRADLFAADLVRGARAYVAGKGRATSGAKVAGTRLSATLADDLARQEKWLMREAKERGYKDIEDLLEKNYPVFEKLAELWRKKHPEDVLLSRSPMKSVTANMDRGLESLARAITEKTTVHRAMFRNGLGWVDFVWGDTGAANASGRTKGAKGLSHIVEARARKDGLTEQQSISLLGELVRTVAAGEEFDRKEVQSSTRVGVRHDGHVVWMTKNAGSNAWIVTGYEVDPDRAASGRANAALTASAASRTRDGEGAGSGNSVPRLSRNPQSTPDAAARAEPAQPQGPWQNLKARVNDLISAEHIDKFLYEFQDELIDLKRLRDHIKVLGGTINDLNDAYLGEELYHKRVAKRTKDFLSEELKPLLADMRSRGIVLSKLEQYLHARHAPEANKEMASRNPNQAMIDAGVAGADAQVTDLELALQRAQAIGASTVAIEKALEQALQERKRWQGAQAFKGTEEERTSLSGMTDGEAAAEMAGLSPEQAGNLRELAARVDAMNAKTMDVLKSYSLIEPEMLAAWKKTYEFYVPLHRDDAHPDSVSHPVGQGFSVKGSASKRRVGSNAKVTHILGHIAMARETALTRGEKNMVMQKLYVMAAQNPDLDWWQIDRPPKTRTIDPDTGLVKEGFDQNYKDKPNVLVLKIAGKDAAIVFNERNERAARLAASMKNLDAGDLHVIMGLAAKATRWFASVNTQYNPVFGIINFARDVQGALLNLSSTPIKGKELEVAKNMGPALKAIYADQRAVRRGGKLGEAGGEWGKLWADMQDAGGTTGYRDLYADPKDRALELEKLMAQLERGGASKFAHGVLDWLSDYNETMEGATRLAAYKVALESGMSRNQAASIAKNLTVNFNRKGRQAREIGALFAFFNAAVQGSARMVETLRGPMGKRIMAGGVLMGAVNAAVGLAMMGGDDDDDENGWNKIPEFVRERSLVFPLGKEDFVAIPLPLGFNVLPNFGRKAVEAMFTTSGKSKGAQLGEMLGMAVNAFNPFGAPSEASFAQLALMASPTVTDPVISLLANKDWTGKPIYREDTNGLDPTPGHLRTKDTASTPSKLVSLWLNKLSGGTDYRPGAISWTPDQLDYVIGQLTGGVGRELMKLNQAVTAPITGEELPAHKIPLLGRIYGNVRGPNAESGPFFENVKMLNEVENELRGRLRDRGDVEEFRQQEPMVSLIGAGNGAEKQMRNLRKLRERMTKEGNAERVKEINEQMGEVMKALNRRVMSVRNAAEAAE